MNDLKLMITIFGLGLVMAVAIPFPLGYTFEEDVYAINSLHAALGYPPLPGWTPFGGDPCLQQWQGVQCVGPNITAIVINDANLGGELGDKLRNFTSIITLDLSNNHIGGSIPENLPVTLRQFFLSSNQLTGTVPSSLADLTLLSDMSLNENFLNGQLPDSFQSLTGLMNLDFSSNNLSGPLPPSIASLSSLTTLHIQDNHLSGSLDVLQDLPLIDLDVQNNQFSGPIPERLWNIANFKLNGNPFNTTVAPSPAPTWAEPSLVAPAPSPFADASSHHGRTSLTGGKNGGKKSIMSVFTYVAVAVIVIVVVLVALFCASKLRGCQLNCKCIPKSRKIKAPNLTNEILSTTNLVASDYSKEDFCRYAHGKQQEHEGHLIEASGLWPIMVEKAASKTVPPLNKETDSHSFENAGGTQKTIFTPPASVTSFSIASLQQHTDYFRDDYLIRSTCLGRLYMVELSEGKLLTILKLDNLTSNINTDDFHELVARIAELRHPNVIEVLGYCSDFGQRLLVFKYFSRATLHDLLYGFLKKKLSWNARIRITHSAARAVEYFHEFCKPPVKRKTLEANGILVDDELAVRISECSLASYVLSDLLTQFSGDSRASSGYKAPEVSESGSYTDRSDVYSFGVVMLELLTGRKPFDSSRSRAEQHLVRWASPQLYDINALSRIVDPSIDGVVSLKSLSRFADIVSRCIQQTPEFRPSMSQIVQDLSLVLKDAGI